MLARVVCGIRQHFARREGDPRNALGRAADYVGIVGTGSEREAMLSGIGGGRDQPEPRAAVSPRDRLE
eukprot:15440454-Alexandrium_andersonii.AAC.1